MKKFIVALCMMCTSMLASASISVHQTEQIFNKLTRANGINAQLDFIMEGPGSLDINAYGGRGHVYVTKAMLKYADRNVMITVLSHELAHATGHISELEADIYSGRIGSNAGLNVCPGAKKFLLTLGLESGDGIHPRGDVRLKAMCRKI